MGAITGLYNLNGAPAGDLTPVLSALMHRGRANDTGSDGCVRLGQFGGTPAEAAVVRDAATGVVVVADARVDNAGELGVSPQEARMPTLAAGVILQVYLRHGAACVDRLVGDFAFAVWDPRTRHLLLARDPMGVKPLYYWQDAHRFAFATELQALLALPFVDRSIDEEQVGMFLLWEHDDRRRTMYRGIRRVPAGHTLCVRADGVQEREYWYPGRDEAIRLGSAEAYAEAFREVFFEAVRVRTGGASPVAAALSGGVDSSSIVCAARELHRTGRGPAVETFSLVFPGLPDHDLKRIDERDYIDAVVRGGGVNANMVRGDELSPLASLDDILMRTGEPHFAPNLYLHWGMFAAAAGRGAEVFLDGFDGDTAVSHGIGRLGAFASRREWPRFESEVRAFAGRRGISAEAVLPHYGLPQLSEWAAQGRWLQWASAFRQLSGRFQLSRRQLLVGYGAKPALAGLLRRHRADRHEDLLRPELGRRLAERLASEPVPAIDPEMERTTHIRSLAQPAYQLTLELADQTAAAFNLSPRYPFFDRRLMALCLSVPAEYKFADGWTRLTMRRALNGVVPNEVLWRMNKANLSPNFHHRLRTDRQMIADTGLEVLSPYVDVRQIERQRARYLEGAAHTSADFDDLLLFRVIILARWLTRAAAGKPSRPGTPVAAA